MLDLEEIGERIHKTSIEHGFYRAQHEESFTAERIALIHEEVSEILSAWRHNKYSEMRTEIADSIIRLLDFYYWLFPKDSLELDILQKVEINEQREYLHGKTR